VHFADVLLDDMKVVEQPFARRPYVTIIRSVRGEAFARVIEDASRFVQPTEKRRSKSSLLRWRNYLLARQVERPLGKAVGAEWLAAERPRSEEGLFVWNASSNATNELRQRGLRGARRQPVPMKSTMYTAMGSAFSKPDSELAEPDAVAARTRRRNCTIVDSWGFSACPVAGRTLADGKAENRQVSTHRALPLTRGTMRLSRQSGAPHRDERFTT
jgi:hypothetical protein